MSKHTPGKWYAFWNENFWQINTESDEFQDMCIGDVCESSEIFDRDHKAHDHAEANARLIAAAPDLLEALEEFINDIVPNNQNDKLWVAGRAAIAKARGES